MVQPQSVTRFDTTDVVPLMTTDEARQCVTAINGHMNSARALLLDLYERRGWAALGYASWRECVVSEFQKSQARLYQQLEAAQIERRISTNVEIGTIPEGQLRPLTRLTPIEQPAAWELAHQYAEAEGAERLTARHVEAAVEEMAPRTIQAVSIPENTDLISDGVDGVLDPPIEPAQAAELFAAAHDAHERRTHIMRVMGSSESPEWYTPRHIVDRVIQVFGQIDLDPCSNSSDPSLANVPALNYWTQASDGLAQPWHGRVYMNPPYGDEIPAWVARLVRAYQESEIAEGIALLPGRIDTAWFQPLWDYTICVIRGRLRFSNSENSAPFPSVVVYLGPDTELFRDAFEDLGRCGKLQ